MLFKREKPPFLYKDPSLTFEIRVKDIVSRMSLKEKVGMVSYNSPAIKRLGIPKYHWWNECLHGVGRAGIATVFPQSIGLGATFDPALIYEIATVISDEARAKHHEFVRHNSFKIYQGLTFWSPNINIFRDPRWGRGQETYGEDPYLTGRMGIAFIKGLQGDDPKYLKVVATSKHYAVHSGPEKDRHHFDAKVSQKDLRETYLPHFKESIKDAHAYSVMGAYNRTNGEPCNASPTLLQKILRDEWGFDGYVVSDCGAVWDFHAGHKVVKNVIESAALGIREGCDLCCGFQYRFLNQAVRKKLITEEEITRSVTRVMMARFKLGMFDPPEMCKYQTIPYSVNDSEKNRQLALRAAQESIILLKNEKQILPLSKNLKTIAVIGPNADDAKTLLGNYNGTPSRSTTPLQGLQKKVGSSTQILYAKGCDLKKISPEQKQGAMDIASRSEVIICVMGISNAIEGEQGESGSDDRQNLEILPAQQELLESLLTLKKPLILVLENGSPVISPWAQEHIPAIIEAWYPGEEGGSAIADVLFGDYCPAGRLPITYVKSTSDLPPFDDYSMKNRTYRYLEKEPLYPFGFGLSYNSFEYSNLKLNSTEVNIGSSVTIDISLKNHGKMIGDEVVQLYLKDKEASVIVPLWSLQGVQRVSLQPNEQKTIHFEIAPRQMAIINNSGQAVLEPGQFEVFIGGSQPDTLSVKLMNRKVLSETFNLKGVSTPIEY